MSKKVTKEWALDFLRAHQPMPADLDFGDDDDSLEQWETVIEYLIEYPCEEAIPLVLNSFGDGDGYGVYQEAGDFLNNFPIEVVIPYLTEALRSPNSNAKEMIADISSDQISRIETDEVSSDLKEKITAFIESAIKVLVDSYPKVDNSSSLDNFILMCINELDENGFLNWKEFGVTIEECRGRDSDEDNLEMYDEIIERHRC